MEEKMKTLFVSLVAFLFAFFVGCQNSITDPAGSDNGEKFSGNENLVNKDVLSNYPGVIKLNGIMLDPTLPFNSYVTISGQVRYNLATYPVAANQNAIKVSLYVDAEMKTDAGYDNSTWKVNDTSEDIVYFTSNDEAIFFAKAFKVQNTVRYPLYLLFEFQVEGKQLVLISKTLKFVHDN